MNRIAEAAQRLAGPPGPRRTHTIGHRSVRGRARAYLVVYTKAARQTVADLIVRPDRPGQPDRPGRPG